MLIIRSIRIVFILFFNTSALLNPGAGSLKELNMRNNDYRNDYGTYNQCLGVLHHAVAHIHHGNDSFCVYSQQTRGPATDPDMNDVLLKRRT